MNVNSVNSAAAYTAATDTATSKKASSDASKTNTAKDTGAVYEKSSSASAKKATYAKEDIVARLKSDAEARTSQMRSLVESMMSKQGGKIGQSDSMWRFLAKGNFTVSADVKAQAQADIADDGYWGVNQTSDRILEFAKALVGDDPKGAESMRAAFEKGFKQATKSWGSKLPDISQRTYDSVMKKFDDWANTGKEPDDTQA